jgi:hypothetical protein
MKGPILIRSICSLSVGGGKGEGEGGGVMVSPQQGSLGRNGARLPLFLIYSILYRVFYFKDEHTEFIAFKSVVGRSLWSGGGGG